MIESGRYPQKHEYAREVDTGVHAASGMPMLDSGGIAAHLRADGILGAAHVRRCTCSSHAPHMFLTCSSAIYSMFLTL